MPQGVRTPLTRPQQQDSSARAHCGFASRRSCSAAEQKRPASFFHLRGKNSLHSAAAPLRCTPLHYATRSGFQNVQRALLFCALALARSVRLSGFAEAVRRLPAARCSCTGSSVVVRPLSHAFCREEEQKARLRYSAVIPTLFMLSGHFCSQRARRRAVQQLSRRLSCSGWRSILPY